MQPVVIKIHGTLNTSLVLMIQIVTWGLLWVASRHDVIWSLLIGIILSFLLLTNYALMHEAAHHVLHVSRRVNYLMGVLTSSIFPMAFTLFEVTHHVHHRGNRTDPELFDYYYPDENKFIKSVQWYGILTGLYYPFVPLGSLLMALAPWIYQTPIFTNRKTFSVLLKDFVGKTLSLVRGEVLFTLLYWSFMCYVLSLSWLSVLIVYGCFGVNWSTRQFVTHAWSPRDVVNGATNLSLGHYHGKLLLDGQWDHVHHKFPFLPWTELLNEKYHEKAPIPYWKQYLSLWGGLRPNFEPSPSPINDIDVHPEITYS